LLAIYIYVCVCTHMHVRVRAHTQLPVYCFHIGIPEIVEDKYMARYRKYHKQSQICIILLKFALLIWDIIFHMWIVLSPIHRHEIVEMVW